MRPNLFLYFSAFIVSLVAFPFEASAQQTAADQVPANCVDWKTYTDTVWVDQDVTENRVVSETSYDTKEVTKSRPRWISEDHERTITEEKPVQQTSEKVITETVCKPVTTTKMRVKSRVEETVEEVTEMRDETYTVRKPVTETYLEKKEVTVRKPVTQRTIERENVTVFRPEQTTQTQLVPGTLLVPNAADTRRRVRYLPRGYYNDPATGQTAYRRRGLHWVLEPSQAAVPVVVPQQQSSVTMVPETLVREKPVETTTFVEETEFREVPVKVERMVEETRTRKVPYTVRVPKRKIIEEQIPYTETTYVEETVTKRVPVTETVMKKVTRTEPVTRIRETWEDYTETVRVPKTTTKRVPYVAKYRVPYLVQIRVPVDANGNPVARGQEVPGTHRLHPGWRNMITKVGTATETSARSAASSVMDKPTRASAGTSDGQVSVFSNSPMTDPKNVPDVLGPAPTKLRFPDRSQMETTTRLKPIVRASAKPVVTGPEETEASIELNERINERFTNLGIEPVEPEVSANNSVETVETSARKIAAPTEAPAKAAFQPEDLSFEVDVPPDAQPPVNPATAPSVEEATGVTIEPDDVKLSRPNRS